MFEYNVLDWRRRELLLEKVLGFKIQKVELVNAQQTVDPLQNSKGIRLDIYAADEDKKIYNVEMQVKKKNIPKRSRYYASCIDVNFVVKGQSYQKLANSYIIFICTFDLFNEGRHLYSFQNRCNQNTKILLNDGAYKVFLNTRGTMDDVDTDIKEFLAYIENTTEQTANNCQSELVKKAHERVETIRNSKECEVEYLTYQERLQEEREERTIEIAEKLMRRGVDMDIIMDTTGLSREDIEEIQKEILSLV